MKCSKCGGTLRYQPGADKVKCDFCGHLSVIDDGGDEPITATWIVPFQVDMAHAERETLKRIADDKTSPVDMVEKVNFVSKRAIYVPMYWARAYITADWSASFGYDYTEQVRTWNPSTKNYNISSVRRTDWRPASGRASTDVECLAVATTDGLPSTLPPQAVAWMCEMSTAGVDDFDEAYLQGMEAIPFEAYGKAHKQQFREAYAKAIKEVVVSHAKGDRQRDWRYDSNLEKERIDTLYVPIYVMEWEYKGEVYTTLIDGFDPSRHMGSPLPVDQSAQEALDMRTTLKHWMMVGWAMLVLGLVLRFNDVAFFHNTLLYLFVGWGGVHLGLYLYLQSAIDKKLGNMASVRAALLKTRFAQDGLAEESEVTIAKPPALFVVNFSPFLKVMKGSVMGLAVLLVGLGWIGYQAQQPVLISSQEFPVLETSSRLAPAHEPESKVSFVKLDGTYQWWEREFAQAVFAVHPRLEGNAREEVFEKVRQINHFLTPNEVPYDLMEPVKAAMKASHFQEAIRLMEPLSSSYAGDATLEANLGYAYLKEKDWRPAFEHIVMAILLDPQEWRYWSVLGDLCREVNDGVCQRNAMTMRDWTKSRFN